MTYLYYIYNKIKRLGYTNTLRYKGGVGERKGYFYFYFYTYTYSSFINIYKDYYKNNIKVVSPRDLTYYIKESTGEYRKLFNSISFGSLNNG